MRIKEVFSFVQYSLSLFSTIWKSVNIYKNEVVFILDKKYLVELPNILYIFKNHTLFQFEQLVDITAVDELERDKSLHDDLSRFSVVYNLLSLRTNLRCRIVVFVGENDVLPSVSNVYSSATWLEREVLDMFGLFFSSNYDLRRILTDYGFFGYPLRKDFPLTGRMELRYDSELGMIVYEDYEVAQDFRFNSQATAWYDANKS